MSGRVLDALGTWLRQPEQSELGRSFVDWLRVVLLPRRMPGVDWPQLENLGEVRTLLAERVKEWTRQWREEGLAEGRKEGGAALLIRQFERKFGPLDEAIRRRINEADADQLLLWGERILTADRAEDVFV